MMNPVYHFARMRALLEEFEPSRERSLAATKLDEAEMWLARCTPTQEALARDTASLPAGGGGGGGGGNAFATGAGSTAVGGAGGGGAVDPSGGAAGGAG